MMQRITILTLCVAVVVAHPGRTSAQAPVRVTEAGLMLDFQEADLRLVIAALAEAGGLNVVYSELPDRRVTLRTTQPVPADRVLALLQSLATANGLELIDEAGFIRLEPAASAMVQQQSGATPDTATQAERRLWVYRLRHARSATLASTLQGLFGLARTPGAAAPAQRSSLTQSLRQLSIPPAQAEQQADAPESQGDQRAATGFSAEIRGDIQIMPDESTNALLVRATPADWAVVEQAIQELDLRPLQVLIEVIIVEVRRLDDTNIGVSVSAGENGGSTSTSAELKAAASGDFTLRFSRSGSVDLDVALSALSASGRVRILSRPVILAQNNQEARILVGAERPFVQVFRSLPTDGGVRDQVVQYRDVGTSLTILPTINPDGYVNLQINQEVSTATSETQFGAPVISTREAMTYLFARDGQTVVIGGLIDEQHDYSRSGIPVLKDIPLLGALFGTTRTMSANTELFLFLTPHIVSTDDDADRVRDGIEAGSEMLPRVGPVRSILPPRGGTPPDTLPGRMQP